MSFQWTFIAGYLYFEVAVVIIMMLPIFSPRRWHNFFKSRLFMLFRQHAAVYFYVLLGVLCLFVIDAVREMNKYSHSINTHLAIEMKGNVKLFRAQRNFYITGFAIFLAFVIRRLVSMIIIQDKLTLKAERIIKEAESTVKLARQTVVASSIQSQESKKYDEVKGLLEKTEGLLKEEKAKVRALEEEVSSWKLKYEEILTKAGGMGDE